MIFKRTAFFVSASKKPKVITPMKDAKSLAGTTAVMKCEIDAGQPKAAVTWYKDGSREIYQGKKYNMTYKDNVAVLEVLQADLSDSALYRVEADNKVGRVDSEAKLLVQG